MNNNGIKTLPQVRVFLDGTRPVEFSLNTKSERYDFVRRTLIIDSFIISNLREQKGNFSITPCESAWARLEGMSHFGGKASKPAKVSLYSQPISP